MAEKKTGLIEATWSKTEDTLNNDQRKRRLNAMRRNAENQLSQNLSEKENAEDALNALLERSKKEDVAFSTICDSYIKAETAKLKHEEFVKLYTTLFGESPLLVS